MGGRSWLERGSSRHRFTAGVSTLLAVIAGILINMVTSGWSWPLGAGMVVFVGGWTVFEVWRAGQLHGNGEIGDRVAAVRQTESAPVVAASETSDVPQFRPGRRAVMSVDAVAAEQFAQLPRDTATFTGRAADQRRRNTSGW